MHNNKNKVFVPFHISLALLALEFCTHNYDYNDDYPVGVTRVYAAVSIAFLEATTSDGYVNVEVERVIVNPT